MEDEDKPLVWLHGEVKTPPFTAVARIEAGFLLRRVQRGELLELPHARPMPSIGQRCYELHIRDADHHWRVIYRIDHDAIVIAEVFSKRTRTTPLSVITTCQERFHRYDSLHEEDKS